MPTRFLRVPTAQLTAPRLAFLRKHHVDTMPYNQLWTFQSNDGTETLVKVNNPKALLDIIPGDITIPANRIHSAVEVAALLQLPAWKRNFVR